MDLLLTETVLFFHNFINDFRASKAQKSQCGLVEDWRDAVTIARSQSRLTRTKETDSVTSSTTAHSKKRVRSALSTTNETLVSVATAPSKISRPKKDIPKSSVQAINHIDTTEYGGLDDEDDTEEREAIMSSPVKGPVRVSGAVRTTLITHNGLSLTLLSARCIHQS